MSDLITRGERPTEEQPSIPPLFLRHYFDETEFRLSHGPVAKPPGPHRARIVERRGNVIVLEFTKAPAPVKTAARRSAGFGRLCRSGWDLAMVLLFLGTAIACVAALVR